MTTSTKAPGYWRSGSVQTPGAAPFSELNREGSHPIHVEAYDTLDDIEDWLEENKADLPHFDQATMFTG